MGLKRGHNEDSILISEDLNLYAVADGMGGHAAGEVASHTAIQEIHDSVKRLLENEEVAEAHASLEGLEVGESIVVQAIRQANDLVCQLAEENSHYFGMGTTVVVALVVDDHAFVAHVGDSRAYRLRDGRLELLTQDHSWVNEQLQRRLITPEEARTHRWRNVITRALGNRFDVEIDHQMQVPLPGDILLLCSDGLTTMLEDNLIEHVLRRRGDDIDGAVEELVRLANDAGGLDNVSVILLRFDSPDGEPAAASAAPGFDSNETQV